jgi:16S rRNA (cytidine1402-2'-O)-methyltransferase
LYTYFHEVIIIFKKKPMAGILYLMPNTLGNPENGLTLPPQVSSLVRNIGVYIVEDVRNARRFLKSLCREIVIDNLVFHILNEHTSDAEIPGFLREVEAGRDAAVLSEAGVPGVADPGARVVGAAHEKGIRVVPLTGPSSILLSLMASGLNGQSFRFHGYLPVKRPERIRKIRQLDQEVQSSSETQIFIETPYRNDALLSDLVDICQPDTRLCIAADLTLATEYICTRPIKEWKTQVPGLHKRPAVFLMGR